MDPNDVEKECLLQADGESTLLGPKIQSHDQEPKWQILLSKSALRYLLPALFFVTIAVLTIIALVTQRQPISSDSATYNPETGGCGQTPAEAAALGCKFDTMNYAWTPDACYDHALSTSSLSSGPWQWFHDHNATQPIEQEVIQRGQEMHVWTEHHFHLVHCLYAFKNIHKATITGQLVPKELVGWNHTLHCEDMLGRVGKDPRKISTKVRMIFNPCARLGDEAMD